MRNSSLFSRSFLVAMGLALSVPALMTGLFELQEDTGTLPGLLRSDIMENQQEYRQSRLIDRCRQLVRGNEVPEVCKGIDISGSPSVSDGMEADEEGRNSAPPSAAMREPTDAERRLLRAYSRAGYCSKAAGQFVYDLCRLQEKPQTRNGGAPMGVLNDNIQLHSARRAYLPLQERLRARYMQTSETLREEFRGPRPMRFEGGLRPKGE